jgi:K+-sensing histidine kinase KdpD
MMRPTQATKALDQTSMQLLAQARRRATLLKAGAQVSHNISSILDPDDLLARTVDIICNAFGFYYAGIFLIEPLDDNQNWAVLKAGRGEAGQKMLANNHKLRVGGQSMVGACTALNQARIALDVGQEPMWFNNPLLPDTRSEMALPLAIGPEVIGALTVQSTQSMAFSEEDISSLQAMADQLAVAINNARLHKLNEQLFFQASRRAVLLQAGAEVSRNATSLLDLDVLLASTVHIICEEFGFYYAGIFLVDRVPDEAGKTWAILRAGRGESGRGMVENGHKLEVGGQSMVGMSIAQGEALIALDADDITPRHPNTLLPDTRSEMALPLIVQDDVIGALTVQSTQEAAFAREDISSLQIMADQLAVAINNARLLRDLERTNRELVRTKTFESIATATGETIHWVGNKAAPIPACVHRIREDVAHFICLSSELPTNDSPPPWAEAIIRAGELLKATQPSLAESAQALKTLPAKKLQTRLDVESIFEDLQIIEDSSNTILNIKEDLIGPARRMTLEKADIVQVVKENIKAFDRESALVQYNIDHNIPPVKIDPRQMGHVITNLVKNAYEALDGHSAPRITITFQRESKNFVRVDVTDNGQGIPKEELTRIWLNFHTSKAEQGGTGLGLPACLQIMEQMQGQINVASRVGHGSTFTLRIPIYQENG